MTDVVDVTPRPRRGRLALAATGVAAAALLVPALGADALEIGGTFTGGPSTVTQGQVITLTATGCVPNIVNDSETAAPQTAVQFTLSIDGGPSEVSPPFPTDSEGTATFSGPVDEDTPPGTYVFHAACGVAGGDTFNQVFAYDETVTITVVAPTTTTAPTTSTTVRPPATTPIAPAARAAAATPRFTG